MSEPFRLSGAGLTVEEMPRLSLLTLRLHRATPDVTGALGQALGLAWPVAPNTAAGDNPCVLWLGPAEWLVAGGEGREDRIASACAEALHHIGDDTDSRVRFAIDGAASRDFLAGGCSLDLHPRAFADGRCAQSLLADMPVLLHRVGGDGFHLYIEAGLAAHLRAWLDDAARQAAQTR